MFYIILYHCHIISHHFVQDDNIFNLYPITQNLLTIPDTYFLIIYSTLYSYEFMNSLNTGIRKKIKTKKC